ncbi:hypothetical protein MKK58_11070 [Methylobacterium sp. J-078]|uniref:hypothetical protein n=1 Tax=Methylobacterium sp. J-078 TaxID=2836657 RepID=UPI001FB89FE1|nr:hypothetical protein [Methylobacterium sp. J-078]MCJ2045063.1 hypothetical protein [Methylobacterium sp. J-078]
MTFSNALPRLRVAVAPVRTLSFRRPDGSKLLRVKARRPRAKRAASGDANVALIMAVMMSLVFGPVIGVHLIAAFTPVATAPEILARGTGAVLPPS